MTEDFWAARVRRHGHTGWSDAATYAFDQRLRLKAIEQVVRTHPPAGRASALDFGCGVGDFCGLLAAQFDAVTGYDVSAAVLARARARAQVSNIHYEGRIEKALDRSHDLVLGVTVLQHIVSDTALQAVLRQLAEVLAPGGRIVVMETLAAIQHDAGYLKRRSAEKLTGQFDAAGLALVARYGFHHPTECPTPAFARYRARLGVRWLGRLAGLGVPGSQAMLRRIAAPKADADPDALGCAGSPTQVMVFERRAA